MADAFGDIFDEVETRSKIGNEQARQATRTKEAGGKDVFDQLAEGAPQPSESDKLRKNLGLREVNTPENASESSQSLLKRALLTGRGMSPSMIGTIAGGALGSRLGPIGATAGESVGGMAGEYLAQKLGWTEPSGGSIALSGIAPVAAKGIKPGLQLARKTAVSMLGSRELVSEAAESLLKKWLNPATTAKDLYDAAEATRKMIPASTTARAVDDLLKKEVGRMPLGQQKEILDTLGPLKDFVTVGRGRGFQMIRSQSVADAMADVRRLSSEAKNAFKAGKADLGNSISKIRVALLDDLEKAGIPEVREASKAFRKEAALEDLGRLISKPAPGTKIRDFARSNPLFENTFSDREWKLIDKVVDKVGGVVPTGMTGAIGRTITTGAGAAAGGWTNPIGYLIGVAGPEAARMFFSSPKGQLFIEKTLSTDIKMGPEWAAAAAAFARGLTSQPPEANQ